MEDWVESGLGSFTEKHSKSNDTTGNYKLPYQAVLRTTGSQSVALSAGYVSS